jgi:hypothetical protein
VSYVTRVAVKSTDKKTSEIGILIRFNASSIMAWIREMEERARVLEILYGMGEANNVERLISAERKLARVACSVARKFDYSRFSSIECFLLS